MEILGTQFALTLGSWRLRFVLALEETEEARTGIRVPSHHLAVMKESDSSRTGGG